MTETDLGRIWSWDNERAGALAQLGDVPPEAAKDILRELLNTADRLLLAPALVGMVRGTAARLLRERACARGPDLDTTDATMDMLLTLWSSNRRLLRERLAGVGADELPQLAQRFTAHLAAKTRVELRPGAVLAVWQEELAAARAEA